MGKMRQWGLSLLILGIGSLILPYVGMQFQVFRLIAPYQPAAGIACSILGAMLSLLSLLFRGTAPQPAATQPLHTNTLGQQTPIAIRPEAKPMTKNSSGPAFCANCGTALEPGAAFCDSCGSPVAQEPVSPAPVMPAQPPAGTRTSAAAAPAFSTPPSLAQPASPAKKSHAVAYVFLTLFAIVLAGGGYFAYTVGLLTIPKPKQPPAVPAVMAGTLSEFPIDVATTDPVKPSGLSTQLLDGPGVSEQVRKTLPEGLSARELSTAGARAITSAAYRSKPTDQPVYVNVMDTTKSSADFSREVSRAIASNSAGATTSGVRVQSPSGAQYDGYKVKTQQTESLVLGKPNSGVVIVIYAPEPSIMPVAERLATTVGNGNGLKADADLSDLMSNLPAQLPSDVALQELNTFSQDELRAEIQKEKSAAGGLGAAQDYVAMVERFLPQQVVTARYRGRSSQEFRVILGDYGNSFNAGKTWLAFRAAAQVLKMQPMNVHGTTGLTIKDGEQEYLVFQAGPRIALVSSDGGASSAPLMQIAEAIQF